ncbi:MAG: glycosyltransferase family 4 protein [Candidatus Firestonebacteria bacterium]|nr:glycosyltransferase family 4 protein [Candidatus Firestonebacteria bacterium]
MGKWVLLDGRPAQGKRRGMGVYVTRLVESLAKLPDAPAIKVALDKNAGADPWAPELAVERLWDGAANAPRWEQSVLPALAEKNGAALVHHTANTAAWKSRVPCVVTVHDAIFLRSLFSISDRWYPRQVAAYLYYRFGVGRGARRARLVLTDSNYSREELIRKLNLDPVRVRAIHLAEPFEAAALPENELDEVLGGLGVRRPYVLGLGAIDRRKNTANLVRAYARLPRSAAPQLVLAGFEKLKYSEVPQIIREWNLETRVKIFGYLEERQLAALFQGAAVFAYPSLEEGFGLPLLQAFLHGIPVITTRNGSLAEVAGEGARFVDPLDLRAMSREMMTLLTDTTESHRLALAGYMQAKKFSWENTARQTADAYRQAWGDLPGEGKR